MRSIFHYRQNFLKIRKKKFRELYKKFGFRKGYTYIPRVKEIIKVMRYIVKVVKNGEIKNIYSTNDYSSAFAVEKKAKQIYENVWICDCVMEILVG